jgi:hypothetical protein
MPVLPTRTLRWLKVAKHRLDADRPASPSGGNRLAAVIGTGEAQYRFIGPDEALADRQPDSGFGLYPSAPAWASRCAPSRAFVIRRGHYV